MKRAIAIVSVIAVVMSFAACGNTLSPSGLSVGKVTPVQTTTTAPTPEIQWPNDDLALQCMEAVVNCPSAEELAPYLTNDSQDQAESLAEIGSPGQYTVDAQYKGEYKGYDMYIMAVTDKIIDEIFQINVVLMERNEDCYKMCQNPATLQQLQEYLTCTVCHGSGSIVTGNRNACGICGGTGVQYIPNAYYDAVMNMWMGQTIGCGGCGGAGYIGANTTATCSHCAGTGMVFP